jgi:hypothetical protein
MGVFLGVDPLETAWPAGHRVFAINRSLQASCIGGKETGRSGEYQHIGRINWKKFHRRHCGVDLLVVRRPKNPSLNAEWESNLLTTRSGAWSRPKLLVIIARTSDILLHADRHKTQR